MRKNLPSILIALTLAAAAALAAPPATAEEAAAPVAVSAVQCAAPVAPSAVDEALFLAGTPGACHQLPACVSTPLGGPETPSVGDQPEPLFLDGGEPCNRRHCGAGQFCCNFSCSICAPEGGFCTQQLCE